MGLTKEQIVEIQEAARLNYAKHQREKEDKKELQRAVDERMGRVSKESGEGVTRPTGLELDAEKKETSKKKQLANSCRYTPPIH